MGYLKLSWLLLFPATYYMVISGSFCHSEARKGAWGRLWNLFSLNCQGILWVWKVNSPQDKSSLGKTRVYFLFSFLGFCTACLETSRVAKRLAASLHKTLARLRIYQQDLLVFVGSISLSLHPHWSLIKHWHSSFASGSFFVLGNLAKTIHY